MLERDAAPGIHRVEDAYTNWYIVEDGDELTIVDAGLPASWSSLEGALCELGFTFGDIRALVLTHAHPDHVGFAERLRRDHGVPVLVHEEEATIAHHPRSYARERALLPYLRHLRALPMLASLGLAGAPLARGISEVRTYTDGLQELNVPGRPRVVFTPGHTYGHCALWFPDRDAIIAGDAIVTLDTYTGRRGPQIMSGAATADSPTALRSLEAMADTDASIVLVGHGEPWRDGALAACERAWEAGPS